MMSFKQTLMAALCIGALAAPEYVSAMDMSGDMAERSCLRPNCCAELEADFNGTFSMLESIQSDLDSLEVLVVNDFNGTFSMLEALLACPCASGSCDLSGAYTMLAAIEATLVADFNGTFSVLADLEALIIDDFNGTFSELIDIKTELVQDFNGTFSVLGNLLACSSCVPSCDIFYLTPADVAGGYLITVPGTYILCGNATITAPITISSNQVLFNLNGNTLTVAGGNDGIVVFSANDVTVKNGIVQNAPAFGILIEGSTAQISIRDVVVTNCANAGIFIDAPGVYIDHCSANNNSYGFVCAEGSSSFINNCSAIFNANSGFLIGTADAPDANAVIQNCNAYYNAGYGFENYAAYISPAATALFANNIAFNNGSPYGLLNNYGGTKPPIFAPIADTTNTSAPAI